MAVVVYSLAFFVFGMMTTLHMNTLTLKQGFLDGQVPRDGIPDLRLKSTFVGLLFVMTVRPVFYCLVAYDRFQMPSITPWLPVHMFLFTTILYFWFYIYHRAMHEVDFLWKFHKTHHMAKHPNALLSAFASRLGDNLCYPPPRLHLISRRFLHFVDYLGVYALCRSARPLGYPSLPTAACHRSRPPSFRYGSRW